MENTIENKQKFFALYTGQPIQSCSYGENFVVDIRGIADIPLKDCWLNLKATTSITEEHALEAGYRTKLHFLHCSTIAKKHPLARIEEIDFLRLKGYALPFMGISVEQLVEYGWIKLTN